MYECKLEDDMDKYPQDDLYECTYINKSLSYFSINNLPKRRKNLYILKCSVCGDYFDEMGCHSCMRLTPSEYEPYFPEKWRYLK